MSVCEQYASIKIIYTLIDKLAAGQSAKRLLYDRAHKIRAKLN